MARIYVNFKYDEETDSYSYEKYGNYVFADQPVAVLNLGDIIDTPLVVPMKGILTIVDRKKYEKFNRLFRYDVKDEKSGEIVENSANGRFAQWIPKNTDTSRLRQINGQLALMEEEPVVDVDSAGPKENEHKAKETRPAKPKTK